MGALTGLNGGDTKEIGDHVGWQWLSFLFNIRILRWSSLLLERLAKTAELRQAETQFSNPKIKTRFCLNTVSFYVPWKANGPFVVCAFGCARHYLHIYPYQYPQQVHKNSILWPRHNKVNKGSRQIQSVTSGKRLALSVARWNNPVAF